MTSQQPLSPDIDVWMLGHQSKHAITPQTLSLLAIGVRRYLNYDWEWPADHPELACPRDKRPVVRGYALRQYRAFRGHQEILRQADPQRLTLVFEDDMTLATGVNPDEVYQHLNRAGQFITEMGYDAVSFHARNQTPPRNSIELYGREYIELSLQRQEGWGHQFFLQPVTTGYGGRYSDYMFRWHEGCLAYLVGSSGREKWLAAGHGHGMPCDLFLANELHTLVMRQTLFHHDQSSGSLIANSGPAARGVNKDGTLS